MNGRCAWIALFGCCLPIAGLATVDPGILPCPAENSVVIAHLDADVTGDGALDRIMLMGKKFDQSSRYMVELSIDATGLDGENELCARLPQDSDSGYDPQLKAMDFTGDGVPDIFVSLPTGGSGGIINYIVYSLKDRHPKMLLDTGKTVIPKFSGRLLPDYKAEVIVDGKSHTIDLKDHKDYYDQMGYYKNSKLLKPTDVWGDGYGLITPVDIDDDGIYELRAVQRVRGINNADHIADIISILKWKEDKWSVVDIEVKAASDLGDNYNGA
ncbi:MAG: hypothetical protein ABFD49_08575 [Armatimonadota bacterium]|nr:hypothetical protein [bacterium]